MWCSFGVAGDSADEPGFINRLWLSHGNAVFLKRGERVFLSRSAGPLCWFGTARPCFEQDATNLRLPISD